MTINLTPDATWLDGGRPVLFFRTWDPATQTEETDCEWRFTDVPQRVVRRLKTEGISYLKVLLQAEFANAPAQVKTVARAAWQESDDSAVIGRVCDILDEFRDNWASFSAASKTWLLAWANKRGIKRQGEA